MQSKLDTWALFFPAPIDAVDQANILACGIRRVQTFLGTASDPRQADNMRWLKTQGIRATLRIEEPNPGEEQGSFYDWPSQMGIMARVRNVQALVEVEAVIIGNESESPYDLTWASHNWGNIPDRTWLLPGGKAQAHNNAVTAMVSLLRPLGVHVCSPGWMHRRIRPAQPAQPGRASWRELCAPSYNACDTNGVHLYADSWSSPEDENRYLWAFGEEVARCHRAVWVNETNSNTGTPIERMRACMRMYDLLARSVDAGRVESFCPFVSNSGGPGYGAGYIMRELVCYQELGAWLIVP